MAALIEQTVSDSATMHNLATLIQVNGDYFDAAPPPTGYLHGIFNKLFPHDFPRSSPHYDKPFAAIEREMLGAHLGRHGIALPEEKHEA